MMGNVLPCLTPQPQPNPRATLGRQAREAEIFSMSGGVTPTHVSHHPRPPFPFGALESGRVWELTAHVKRFYTLVLSGRAFLKCARCLSVCLFCLSGYLVFTCLCASMCRCAVMCVCVCVCFFF